MTARPVRVHLTDFDGSFGEVLAAVVDQVSASRVACALDGERQAGRGYYPNICFKLFVEARDKRIEIGDGGFVGWAGALLANRKERLLIGGVSLERLAMI